ncbi:GNAT family N-acetyltransferase [Candidatus Pantoea multigeneris]|uniref:GNAT family N-acetyltransferase n=1 Tax=Candidatus Pantoea multigeneris TaxID=2608357 RepID=A0ABX0RMT0_9GAMM|nr:GNAT family N-acetyltransferase [Pantoea multigeneris]NIF24719.1 GNAT family N-acetyltransferase [Pantoea multigeneris]
MNIISGFNVTLRMWKPEDVAGYMAMAANQEVMKYISNGEARTQDVIEREIERFRASQQMFGFSRWAATNGEEKHFMGFAGFEKKEYGINFGMRYDTQWWGTPFPFISGHLALTHAFDELGLDEVYTLTNVKNAKAINMNMKYLQLKTLKDDVLNTEFGPHQRIIYTKALFESVRESNEAKIEKLLDYKRFAVSSKD